MVSAHIALRLVAASILISGVAFAGSAMAKPVAEPATQKVASVVTADSGTIAAAPSAAAAPAPLATDGACSRKVKVVYAGYGEAARASCIVSSSAASN